MKIYVLLSGTVDGASCENEGFINCANFDVIGDRVFSSFEEAKEIRDQTIETDVEDFHGLWVEEDGYSYDTGELENGDIYIDVYYNGDIINETIYKIREVEL